MGLLHLTCQITTADIYPYDRTYVIPVEIIDIDMRYNKTVVGNNYYSHVPKTTMSDIQRHIRSKLPINLRLLLRRDFFPDDSLTYVQSDITDMQAEKIKSCESKIEHICVGDTLKCSAFILHDHPVISKLEITQNESVPISHDLQKIRDFDFYQLYVNPDVDTIQVIHNQTEERHTDTDKEILINEHKSNIDSVPTHKDSIPIYRRIWNWIKNIHTGFHIINWIKKLFT